MPKRPMLDSVEVAAESGRNSVSEPVGPSVSDADIDVAAGRNSMPAAASSALPEANVPAEVPQEPENAPQNQEVKEALGEQQGQKNDDAPEQGGKENKNVVDQIAEQVLDNNDGKRVDPEETTIKITRKNVLKKKLVTDHKKKKDDDNSKAADVGENANGHTSSLKHLNRIDNASAGFTGASVVSAVAGSVPKGLGVAASMTGGAGSEEYSKTMSEGEGALNAADYINVATAGLGTVAGGLKMGANIYRAKKSKNRKTRDVAKYRAAAGALAMGQSITSGLSSGANLGMFGSNGRVDGTAGKSIGGAMDILSGTTGFVSNILDYVANKKEKQHHKDTAKDAMKIRDKTKRSANAALDSSRNSLKAFKNKDHSQLSGVEMNDLKNARQSRHTAKAQLYAMKQAEMIHNQRAKENTKGLLSAIGGGFGFAGSLLTGASKFMGNAGGLGAALGMVGSIGSIIGVGLKGLNFGKGTVKEGMGADKSNLQSVKIDVLNDYLKDKTKKIKDEAKSMALTRNEERALGDDGRELSDEEAEKIAVMRLGVEVDLDGENAYEPLTAEQKDKAFQKLTEKRAKNILNSSKEEKTQMMGALGLEPDATFEEVVAALSGD